MHFKHFHRNHRSRCCIHRPNHNVVLLNTEVTDNKLRIFYR